MCGMHGGRRYSSYSARHAAALVYLAFGHVDAGDMAALAHQLAQHVAVPATPAAQVQYPAALQALWHHQPTAIVPGEEEKASQGFNTNRGSQTCV